MKLDGENKPLLGAEFTLKDSAENLITFVASTEGADHQLYRVAESDDAAEARTTTIKLDAKNKAMIRGLDAGTYTLTESKAPDGYNILTEPITLKVTTDDTTGGQKVLVKIESDDTAPGGPVTVTNQAGSELPETGGVGTTLFYVFGAILFLGAGAVLIARRKVADR